MKIKRRRATKITKKRLDEYLALVGWSSRFHGASCWRLYNPYGQCSAFMYSWRHEDGENAPIYDLRIDEFTGQRPFGDSDPSYAHAGILAFLLKDCFLEANSFNGDKWDFVSICPKDNSNAAYISFSSKFEPSSK